MQARGGGRERDRRRPDRPEGRPGLRAQPGRSGGRSADPAGQRGVRGSPALSWESAVLGPSGLGSPLGESRQGLRAAVVVAALPRPRDCRWEPPGLDPGAGGHVQPARRRFDVEPPGFVPLIAREVCEHPSASYLQGQKK